MSFASYDPNARYRQRSAQRTGRVLVFVFLFAFVFGVGYWFGGMRLQQDMYILQEEKRVLRESHDKAQNDMIELRAEAQTANVRLEQLRASYDELFSEGPMQDLLTLVREQIEQGVDVKRLESVILSARPPQNCNDADSKRFVVKTPAYKGPSSRASIADGLILVYGEGAASRNAQGHKEAWFDPGQAVRVVFEAVGVGPVVKKGLLPIYHSMVIDDKEYRFTVTDGAKSFAKVTFDHCDYP